MQTMTEYVPAGEFGEHLIPKPEQGEHTPHDFCGCNPEMRPYMGRWFWVHKVVNESFDHLIQQAEAIRQVTSIKLWRDIEGKNIKHQVMPFPAGFDGAHWPKAAEK